MNTRVIKGAALLSMLALTYPAASNAGVSVGISVGFAPPPIPVYVQPPCPVVGYIWTPGYWAWSADADDYYWVPGAWIAPPSFGFLWTPGYWGFADGAYLWHAGYWGPHVGFYGGINYGFGYFGSGFQGGYWRGHDFFYNRAAANVTNISVTNVYNHTVVNNYSSNRASFNGPHGIEARPSHQDMLAARDAHRGITGAQRTMMDTARREPGALAAENHGHPATPAERSANFGHRSVEPVHRETTVAHNGLGASHNGEVPHPSQPPRAAAFAGAHPAASHVPSPPAHSMQHNYPAQHYEQPRQAAMPAHLQPQHSANVESRHTATRSAEPRHVSAPRPASRMEAPQHANAPRPTPRMEAPRQLEARAQPAPHRAGPEHESHH